MNRSERVLNNVKQLDEKSIVNKKDVKRLVQLIKKYKKVNYKGKEYTAKMSTTSQFIILIKSSGDLKRVPITDVREYSIPGDVVHIKI